VAVLLIDGRASGRRSCFRSTVVLPVDGRGHPAFMSRSVVGAIMFGTSGIRGPVGEAVTADLALRVGHALAVDADRVVVGRDPRESGRFLADAVAAGLRECGTDVVRLGQAATPTVARSVAPRNADAGVAVTASHNPPEDNGLKLWQPSGQAFDEPLRAVISERVREGAFDPASWDDLGSQRRWEGARERHVTAIVESIAAGGAPVEELSVAVDLGNGAGGASVDALLALGASVETLNGQSDGRFPGRPSEPTAENCGTLRELVSAGSFDLGIAHDGDADRMLAVTENGVWVSGDVLLALFAREAVEGGERVAVPVDTSLAVADAVSAVGGETVRTRVGDVYVAEAASEAGVAFGGEPSGAWIWPGETLCPDGPLAAAKLVALVADRGPLSELVASVETYPIRRTSVEVAEKAAVMERVAGRVDREYDDVTTLDGVRVDLGEAWFLVRASGTQPLVRVTAEAREAARADSVFEEARALVENATDER
jgi:phosphoglucosamine mutase